MHAEAQVWQGKLAAAHAHVAPSPGQPKEVPEFGCMLEIRYADDCDAASPDTLGPAANGASRPQHGRHAPPFTQGTRDAVQCMGGRLNTPRSLCREPGGSEPTPGDLQAMLSASAGLGARGHSTAAGALLGDDEDEDDEYGPKRPVAPKVHAAHALQLTRTPQLSGLLCLSSLRPNARPDCQGLGAKWLREWCARASAGAAAAGADDSAALAVARALLCAASGDELAAQLYNLFGDAIDLQAVQELVELRWAALCRAFACHRHALDLQAPHQSCAALTLANPSLPGCATGRRWQPACVRRWRRSGEPLQPRSPACPRTARLSGGRPPAVAGLSPSCKAWMRCSSGAVAGVCVGS